VNHLTFIGLSSLLIVSPLVSLTKYRKTWPRRLSVDIVGVHGNGETRTPKPEAWRAEENSTGQVVCSFGRGYSLHTS